MRPASAILALALLVPPALLANGGEGGPRAVAGETVHDFGKVPPRDVLVHTFEIRNTGSEPLRVLGVESSCTCTVARFDEVIAPGGTGTVTAEVDTRSLDGQTTGILTVRTNDPDVPALRLLTQVVVEPVLGARPGYGRWSYVHGEPEGTITQSVFALDGKDFRVLRVVAPEQFRTSFRPAAEDELRDGVAGPQWRVAATLDAAAPVGPITGFLEVHTDHPEQPVTRIPLSGFVRPAYHVTPPEGTFGEIEAGSPQPALFVFKSFTTVPVTLLGAESTVAGTDVVVLPQPDGRTYRVEVRFTEEMPAGAFSGTLRLRTSLDDLAVTEVPLSGTIVRAQG